MISKKELEIRLKLKNDFPHFAYKCLKIRSKSGLVIPLALNKPQLHFHDKIEEQKKRTGKVRVISLKGRQEGISTYIGGRYYHVVSHRNGYRAFILTHQQDATDNLFEMVKRYYNYCPGVVKPIIGANSAKELNFISPESGYKVGTAGSKGIGRSSTIQLFHGSEVAFWENAAEHMDGIMQAIPNESGTEVILESTANGKGNTFYYLWKEAVEGSNDLMPVFLPWYWMPEYRLQLTPDFVMTDEEHEYKRLYELDNEQINWRRMKINSSQKKELGFKQEYPANPEEAFIVTGGDCLISNIDVERASKCRDAKPYGIKYVGVDPARFGDDRTSIIRRQGRVAYKLQSYLHKDTMEVVGLIVRIIKEESPDFLCIDVGGLGAGIVDRLRELGYGKMIKAINSGEKALDDNRFFNKRAEMWGSMKDWLNETPVSIPVDDSLHSDLCAPFYSWDSLNRLKIEKKEDMKRRGVHSPDDGDALALTFAFPAVNKNVNIDNIFTQDITI
jgi:hypothetical protein